ncbi:uncharacterized protein LOC118404476 [Branchiostoma floridae]|uniref:Uncharacterized protein LOC118404476 n=1 Tax=Branchiostoma floridae TaxID=7739 RepID=A0A9J7HK52_BRAFL|nr:uncharacterized protein LOC118404476 [Branchiostoma floridae]
MSELGMSWFDEWNCTYFPESHERLCLRDICEDDNTTGSHSYPCILVQQAGCRPSIGSSLVGDVMTGNSSRWSVAELSSYFSRVKDMADRGDSMSAYACYQEGCDDDMVGSTSLPPHVTCRWLTCLHTTPPESSAARREATWHPSTLPPRVSANRRALGTAAAFWTTI